MYIRRKVFSLLNVDGETRYFSTTDYTLEQREFGRGKSARNRKQAKKFRKSNVSSEQINTTVGGKEVSLPNTPKNKKLIGESVESNKALEATKQKANEVLKQGQEVSKDLKSYTKNSGKAANASGVRYERMDEYGRQKTHQRIDKHANSNDINRLRKESHSNVQRLAAAEGEIDRLNQINNQAQQKAETASQNAIRSQKAAQQANLELNTERNLHTATKSKLEGTRKALTTAEGAARKFEGQAQKTAKTLKRTRIGGGVALAGTAALGAGLVARERSKNKKLRNNN